MVWSRPDGFPLSSVQMAPSASQPAVVRNTLYRVQDKLGIKTKQDLAIWAVRNGVPGDVDVDR